MRRYRLDIAYDGTDFAGWQVQPGRRTVQAEVSRALGQIGEDARPIGSGRTDAGVHALINPAHVDLQRDWAPEELCRALRGVLPGDVGLVRVAAAKPDFHARFDAESRTYHYALGLKHNPFFRFRRWCPRRRPDPEWARTELRSLIGERDAAAFMKSGSGASTSVCRIVAGDWRTYTGGAVLSITADRFLYGMVRALVGSLVRGYERGENAGHLLRVLETGQRSAAGEAAPPWGLYLAGVVYPGEPAEDQMDSVAQGSGLSVVHVSGRSG